jgi:hypothetical protein
MSGLLLLGRTGPSAGSDPRFMLKRWFSLSSTSEVTANAYRIVSQT